ncbi:MAG: hypothetical protein RLZ35_356 [Pseudomonadota bacterium]
MLDRPAKGEKAILVQLHFRHRQFSDLESDSEEFVELAVSAGAQIVASLSVQRDSPDAKYFIGTGKVEELAQLVSTHHAEVVIFNTTLSPSQERNLEKELRCRVLDRTRLILDIFAQRARTFEGKLQVELAQLEHHSTRLVRGWTHLERQKGGIGLRGPGETQLETDRRLIRQRIGYLKDRLERVRKQRQQSRQARQKATVLTISLVGYTNAGKSTLFNRLAHEHIWAVDQLFATLDPTLRTINMGQLGQVVLADTVGFIQHLPHELVEAFRATLEETQNADLLLHVIDASNEDWGMQVKEVEQVLEQINALNVPRLAVYNKIDLLPHEGTPHVVKDAEGKTKEVWISAAKGLGMDVLRAAVVECLASELMQGTLRLPVEADTAKLQAALFAAGAVVSHEIRESGDAWLHIALRQVKWSQLCHQFPELETYWQNETKGIQ